MKIAVIGMGNVGGVLGRRWAEARHGVTFGARRPENPQAQAEAKLRTIAEAASELRKG